MIDCEAGDHKNFTTFNNNSTMLNINETIYIGTSNQAKLADLQIEGIPMQSYTLKYSCNAQKTAYWSM